MGVFDHLRIRAVVRISVLVCSAALECVHDGGSGALLRP